MEINEKNIEEELDTCINEVTDIVNELQLIETDTPVSHDHIMELDARYVVAAQYLPEMILFLGRKKPLPEMMSKKFLRVIKVNNDFISEKIRIIDNTPDIYLETNDLLSLN